jgi:molybdopterin synthase sulfur carrier subunit
MTAIERPPSSKAAVRTVRVVYFAWVREQVGRGDEQVELPADVATVADLVTWLKSRGPEYAAAFARAGVIRAAIDHAHVKADAPIAGAREIAFFPPVTGG